MTKNKIKDVDLVRWASVKVLMKSAEFMNSSEENRSSVSKKVFKKMMSADVDKLMLMLDLKGHERDFCIRVQKALQCLA